MGALLALVLSVAYLWLAYWLFRRATRPWIKLVVVCVAVLLPTADAVYGRLKLREMCAEEGGLNILKQVRNVDGFLMMASSADEQLLRRSGYKFVETERKVGGRRVVDRLSLRPDGAILAEKDVFRQSQYLLRFLPGNPADNYMRSEYLVESIDGTETLGRIRNFSYSGGWVERTIAALYGGRSSAGTCGLNRDTYASQFELLKATLTPN